MSHLPPKPEFGYPPRYPPDPRDYGRPPPPPLPPPAVYPPDPDRHSSRVERHIYPPRSPPRTRAPPMDSYVPGRAPVDTYRARPPPPPMDTYVGSFYDRREDDRLRPRDWERRDDHRARPRDAWPRDDIRRGHERERRERAVSREREWVRPREDERRIPRERPREVEPERKWIPRPSKSPPKRVAPAKAPERTSHSPVSRGRTPSSPKRRLASQPPLPASGSSSPYKVERSRPLRPPSPGEIGPSTRPPPRARRERSPAESERRWASSRRSPTPDRRRRYGGGFAKDYRERERRSSRRRSKSPPRRRTPPPRKRTPTPPSRSRSRTRSPTQTPPPKRHVLPPAKSPSRLTPPPPLPLLTTPIEPRIERDGDVRMEDVSGEPELEPASSALEAPEPAPVSATLSVASRIASPAQTAAAGSAPASSPRPTTPTIPPLPPKPEPEIEQKPLRRRRSKSPPTGPRIRVPISPVIPGTPPQIVQPVPNLPLKPEWTRRNTASHPTKTESPAPPVSTAAESNAPSPVIPPYQPKSSASFEIEAEIARIRAQRLQIDTEYVQVAAATQRALQEYDLSAIDLKMAEKRRELAEAAIEKAELGMLGMDNIAVTS